MNAITKFFFRLKRFEFWPFPVFYAPVFLYYLYLSIKHRSFLFFTASNPSIENGGMMGESKKAIFELIPDEYLPKTVHFNPTVTKSELLNTLKSNQIIYPFVLKPDIGERGRRVELIETEAALDIYLTGIKVDFMAQEYIEWPVELGVFYYRFPNHKKGTISSLVKKGFLSVTGSGMHTIRELLQKNKRALLTYNFDGNYHHSKLDSIPKKGESIIVEKIGNHCRGTTFFNAYHEIDEKLIETFDKISSQIDGFYFGRFDLRCASIDQLKKGKAFKILELNGAGAEPGHIYDPNGSLFEAYSAVFHHMKVLSKISMQNHERGVPYWSFKMGFYKYLEVQQYQKSL